MTEQEKQYKSFKFYENFWIAIEQLPIEDAKNACYEFCKFGVTGELPKNPALKMFCLGVSASVQKYQGRGGVRVGAGRPKNNQKNQKNQNNQKNHNTQTETETETETKTKIIKEKKSYGEFANVLLTNEQYQKLEKIYCHHLSNAIETLSTYIESSGKKYKNHYAVLGKHNWVYKKLVKEEEEKNKRSSW